MTAGGELAGDILLQPGSLRSALELTTREALRRGALRPIETEQLGVEDAGVRFLVRMVSSLRRKEAERRSGLGNGGGKGRARNPFLPPEPELTVSQVSRSHLAVLNKFNVLDRHLLVVTRRFEHQETLLTVDDFRALLACMDEYPGLGFYNGGAAAGASQPHKHLQLVPLPLAPDGPPVPVEPLLEGAGPRCPGLPFAHAFVRRKPGPKQADEAHQQYLDLLARLGIRAVDREGEPRQSAPYNLLVTDGWMLAVPRLQECFRGVSINALGFAGSLFVKDRAQLELIRAGGPMRVLATVAGPVDP
jgi:ATP adenylyltransferase